MKAALEARLKTAAEREAHARETMRNEVRSIDRSLLWRVSEDPLSQPLRK